MIGRAIALFQRLRKRLPHDARLTIASRVLDALGVEASELDERERVAAD
jgi:hypothetical protein